MRATVATVPSLRTGRTQTASSTSSGHDQSACCVFFLVPACIHRGRGILRSLFTPLPSRNAHN
ncbi:hypothetical protein OE88DRAFT_1667613 [Heliocybe sulcata]|uniref:Uncharacterized protein n=1 Tax=Heliocybe sulcata TaxID=5364 RepID=A0A5C3MYJ2_9AGAM|nr:hypothetical protein OE88DRAFT_1667613 [Heliocybe sulcata]